MLRDIGLLGSLGDFIKAGFSDNKFPITESSLPQCLREEKRSEFIEAQHLMMTQSLELERGKHCYYKRGEPLPFETQEILGSGKSSRVDRIVSLISYKEYTRKQSRRSAVNLKRKEGRMKSFLAKI